MTCRTLGYICVVGILLLFTGAAARADNIDFSCSLSLSATCSGTVQQLPGGNFTTTGITVFNDSGPYSATVPFTLVFNTAAGTISIDGTGVDATEQLIGTITTFFTGVGNTSTDISFTADWPTLPSSVQAFLGTPTGTDSGSVIALNISNTAQSVDVLITPAPEPGSLALLAVGLLGAAGIRRRKLA